MVPDRPQSGEFVQFGDELLHRPVRQAGDRPVGVADHTVGIDDEHAAAGKSDRAERAVEPGDRLVGIGEQRELEAVLAGERVVAADVLGRDAQHLGVELV